VDIGANTGVSLLTVIAGLREDFAAVGIELGALAVTTPERDALAEVPKLSVAAPWAAGPVDPTVLLKIATGARVNENAPSWG
jgi:hypothetical protein